MQVRVSSSYIHWFLSCGCKKAVGGHGNFEGDFLSLFGGWMENCVLIQRIVKWFESWNFSTNTKNSPVL